MSGKEESQTTLKVPQNSRRRIRFSPSGTTKPQRENYRAEPEKKLTSRHARYRADPEKERTVIGIEQILKRNGLLKDSDIAIVLNVHLARRKELRSLKGMAYLYNLPLISRWIT